jgi:hypothetical protein
MRFVFFICVLAALDTSAQKKIKSVEVSDTILHAYIDRPGDLYLLTKNGHLQRFDPDGRLGIFYKCPELPSLFDPRDGARLFMYFRSVQQYEYRSPSLEITKAFRMDPSFAIQPWLIAPSGDHKLWVLDAADHSLKKINPGESVVEVEVEIDSTIIKDATKFDMIREYQGFVFIHDPAKGIHIFNGIGKHIKSIEDRGIRSFNFLGEELYFVTKGKLKFFDLFSTETREVELPVKCIDVLMSDVRTFYIQPKQVEIYEN